MTSNETTREAFMKILSTNPKWQETPKSGEVFGIGGARPLAAAKPISLSDKQLEIVMDPAADLPVEKRAVLLERIAARLRLIGHFDDDDLERAVRLAQHNLRFSTSRETGEIKGTDGSGLLK